jgi:2-keto-3-deoxy-L-rhamnonate aldolase RhmA
MLEHVDAVSNAAEILSVPGIDAFFIGPNDLHNSMGRPPAFESDHPEFVQAVDHLLACGKRAGVPGGIHVLDAATAQRRIDQGFRFMAITSEAGMMLGKAREITSQLGRGGQKPGLRY